MAIVGAAQIQLVAQAGARFVKSVTDSVNKVAAVPIKVQAETRGFLSQLTKDIQSSASTIKIPIPTGATNAQLAALTKQTQALNAVFGSLTGGTQRASFQLGTFEQRLDRAVPRMSQALRVGGALSASLNRLGFANGPLGQVVTRFAGLTTAAQGLAPVVSGLFSTFPRLSAATGGLGAAFGGLEVASLGVSAGLAAVPIVAGAVVAGFKAGVAGALEEDEALAQVNARIQSTGGIAQVSSAHIASLGAEFQRTTKFTDAQVEAASAVALSFTNVRNTADRPIFDQALKGAADLSTAFGTDLTAASKQLFSALNDPIKGIERLGRAGVRFSESEKEAIKTMVAAGDQLGAQEAILAKVEERFGGAASAAGETLGGSFTRLKNQAGEFLEVAARPLIPVLQALINAGLNLANAFTTAFVKTGILKTAFTLLFRPLLVVFRLAEFVFKGISAGFDLLGKAVQGFLNFLDRLPGPIKRVLGIAGGAFKNVANFIEGGKKGQDDLASATINAADAFGLEGDAIENVADQQLKADQATQKYTESLHKQDAARIEAKQALEDLADAEENYQNVLHGFPASSKEAIEAQEKLDDARLKSADAALDIRKADLDLIKAQNELTEAQEKADVVLHGYGETSKEGQEALEDLQEATEDVTNANIDLAESILKVQRTQLDLERDQFIAIRTAEVYGASSRAAALANQELAESQQELISNQNDVVNDQDELADAQRELAEQQIETTNTISGFPADSKEAQEALDDLAEKELAVESATLAVQKAQLESIQAANDYRDAQEEIRNVLEGYPADSDEAKEATRKLEDAQLKAVDKADDYAQAQLDVRDAFIEQNKELEKNVALLQARNNLLNQTPEVFFSETLPSLVTGFAEGGSVKARQPIVVGEKGAELFIPAMNGTIIPNSALAQASRTPTSIASLGVSGQPILIQFNVDGRPFARKLVPHIRAVELEKR